MSEGRYTHEIECMIVKGVTLLGMSWVGIVNHSEFRFPAWLNNYKMEVGS